MRKRLASTCVLVLGVAAFAGSASAGSGNGKGKHDAGSGAPAATDTAEASAPGNSANAPGQIKKEAGAEPGTPVAVTESAPAGVKPASDTEKDTHAAASSDKTKLYGNGKTAGQVAMQNGAPASTMLHGPGNSQPHKAAACPGGHEVDVHALRGGRRGKPCGRASPPDPNPGPGSNPGGGSSGGGSAPGPGTNPPGSRESPAGPGPKAGSSEQGESQGVLAETGIADQVGSLPFTGFPLWVALLVGIGLILVGFGLLRRTKVTG